MAENKNCQRNFPGCFFTESGIAVVINYKSNKLFKLFEFLLDIDPLDVHKHELMHRAYHLARYPKKSEKYEQMKVKCLEDPRKTLESVTKQKLENGKISFRIYPQLSKDTGLDSVDCWVLEVDPETMYKINSDLREKISDGTFKGKIDELLIHYFEGEMENLYSFYSVYRFSDSEIIKAKMSLEKLEAKYKNRKEIIKEFAKYKDVEQLYEATKNIKTSRWERLRCGLSQFHRDLNFSILDSYLQLLSGLWGAAFTFSEPKIGIPLLSYFISRKLYKLAKKIVYKR